LLGRGTLWSKRPLLGYAFGGLRDVGFGVYARVDRIRGSLQERWAGVSPPACIGRAFTLLSWHLPCLQRIMCSAAAAAAAAACLSSGFFPFLVLFVLLSNIIMLQGETQRKC